MKNLFRTLLIASLLLGGASVAGAQFSIGIRVGPPPPVRVERVPTSPGPDYIWVRGYWYADPDGDHHYIWHQGYWTRPPYDGAHWVPPHRDRGQFYEGYWDGPRGRVEHDHDWDRDNDRDYDRNHDRDDDRNR